MNKRLASSDRSHIQNVRRYIKSGNLKKAAIDLQKIPRSKWSHPTILRLRYSLLATASFWELAADVAAAHCELNPRSPAAWISWANALDNLGRTQDARIAMLLALTKARPHFRTCYTLGCFSCKLKDFDEALYWLKQAIGRGDSRTIRQMALADPNFEPLREQIANL